MTLEESGFGESLRGGGAICFGTKAIDDFLTQGGLSYIIRAHEAHSEGVSLSKGAKVNLELSCTVSCFRAVPSVDFKALREHL